MPLVDKHKIERIFQIPNQWTRVNHVAIMWRMKAKLIAKSKEIQGDGSIVELIIWELPEPVPPRHNLYKCRLYFGLHGTCRGRYDNKRGKGDHKHIGLVEIEYTFTTIEQLLDDFEYDITNWSEV